MHSYQEPSLSRQEICLSKLHSEGRYSPVNSITVAGGSIGAGNGWKQPQTLRSP